MKRLHLMRFAVLFAALLAPAAGAQGVPQEISFTGNLTNSGMPETGTHTFIFRLFDLASGGTLAWSETQNLTVNNGKVFATLGSLTPLTSTIFNGATLYLEVTIDTVTLSQRSPILSVPYSVRAGTANTAETLGSLTPGSVQQRLSSCGAGSAIQTAAPNGNVTCITAGGDITGVIAGAGLAGGATTGDATLGLITCGLGQVLKAGAGGSWGCANDTDTNTTYTNQAPVSLTGTTFGLTNCGANQIYKMNVGGTAWACAADVDTDTGVNAVVNSGGITGSIAGRTLTLGSDNTVQRRTALPSCPTGTYLRAIAQDGTPTCLPALTCTRVVGPAPTTSTQSVLCAAGSIVMGGGCSVSGSTNAVLDSYPISTTSWFCRTVTIGTVQSYAICCDVSF